MKCFILFTHWWFSFSIFRLLWFLCLSISLLSLLHACLIFVLCFLCNNWNCIYDTCTHTFNIFFLLFFFFFFLTKEFLWRISLGPFSYPNYPYLMQLNWVLSFSDLLAFCAIEINVGHITDAWFILPAVNPHNENKE